MRSVNSTDDVVDPRAPLKCCSDLVHSGFGARKLNKMRGELRLHGARKKANRSQYARLD